MYLPSNSSGTLCFFVPNHSNVNMQWILRQTSIMNPISVSFASLHIIIISAIKDYREATERSSCSEFAMNILYKLTISLIQQFCSRRLNIFCQNMEKFYNWMDNLWLKVENIVAKGEIARFEQFLLL